MLFAAPGEYKACGIFTPNHFKLIIITILGITIALKYTINKSKEEVYKIIKHTTIMLIFLEIIRIVFCLKYNDIKDVNTYLPLYYCSLLLYAGILSSFCREKLKRMGDVFLATGSIIGGVVFIIFPTTSLLSYPAMHFISIHSFLFHGIMVYLGILINKTKYINLQKQDIIYFAVLVGVMCQIAYIINKTCNSNLMFISSNFPGTLIEIIYNLSGKLFTPIMCIAQMFLPFYIIYGLTILINKREIKNKENNTQPIIESEEKVVCYQFKK